LESQLADPAVLNDQQHYATLSRRYAEISAIAALGHEWNRLEQQQNEAASLLSDPDLADLAHSELAEIAEKLPLLEAEITEQLTERDPADEKSVIIEIRAGTGGDEAALFAANLFELYNKHALALGFTSEMLDSSQNDLGGFAKVAFEVSGRGAYGQFKYESGVHRVQRVPATEAAGRIHTSTATVAVMPEAEETDFKLEMSDLRIDVYRASGHGGQGVNTTDSAVRIVYRAGTPDEIVVTCQDGRSQLKNKEKALVILRSRLYERQRQQEAETARDQRRSQIGTGERSEKIRTYNYPQNRITDHRMEGESKNFPLNSVMAAGIADIHAALEAWIRAGGSLDGSA
jgi:peptide chain release factor 1